MEKQIERQQKIATLNDAFRRNFRGGRLMMSVSIATLPSEVRAMILGKIASFADFDADNDPYGEHDFGSLHVAGNHVFWKIDYFDERMEYGSEDPADPAKTTRVLTIMLADEY
jgi:hypothetical protein